MRQAMGGARRWVAALVGMIAVGILGSAAARSVASGRIARGRGGDAGVEVILARAQRSEERIVSGRVLLARTTENNPISEQELRERIKDPKQLQVELGIARTMPRQIIERETIRFDNRRNRLLTETKRQGGQVAANRALFTPVFFKTYTELRDAPPEERHEAFINKPIWPPYSPYERWQGRCWRGRIAAIRKGQIIARRLEKDPRTGETMLFLAGGPGAQLDGKVWIDAARGYTIPHLQASDTKSGRLEIDERAHYRCSGGLWYPDRLVTTYYRYDGQGRRELSRRETFVVTEARLNLSLPDAAFALAIPRGAFVQDDRVNPPLVYHEGVSSPQQVLRQREERRRQALRVGQAAPEFELPALSGEKLRLADLRGRVVVLNLFAFW